MLFVGSTCSRRRVQQARAGRSRRQVERWGQCPSSWHLATNWLGCVDARLERFRRNAEMSIPLLCSAGFLQERRWHFLSTRSLLKPPRTQHQTDGFVRFAGQPVDEIRIVATEAATAALIAATLFTPLTPTLILLPLLGLMLNGTSSREGIRVNCIRPGHIYTEMHASGGEPGTVDRIKDSIPLGRGGPAGRGRAGDSVADKRRGPHYRHVPRRHRGQVMNGSHQ